MPNRVLRIKRLERGVGGEGRDAEYLEFVSGVNLISGPPNSGKTKWLSMLDYVFGDADSPENAFGVALAEKYQYARAIVQIGDTEYVLERRWSARGLRTKTLVDREPMDDQEFSSFMLEALGIQPIVFPRGDPANLRAWVPLTLRMLLRHLYRQERFWSDIADQQPQREQHTCLMTFLGVAHRLYPPEYNTLFERRNRVATLQARREQFMEVLHRVTTEITQLEEAGVALTPDSLTQARSRLESERESLEEAKRQLVSRLADAVQLPAAGRERYELYGAQVNNLHSREAKLSEEAAAIQQRIEELEAHVGVVRAETGRLERARVAGELFKELRVSHCPVCDQAVEIPQTEGRTCYLCQRPVLADDEHGQAAARVSFEQAQLADEGRELSELLDSHRRERARLAEERRRIRRGIEDIDRLMQPVTSAVAAVLPPDLALIDRRIGGVDEQLRTIGRIEEMLRMRADTAGEIDAIAREVAALDEEVDRLASDIDYARLGDVLSDGLNHYFNALGRERWPAGSAQLELRPRSFHIKVDGRPWAPALGATLKCYFLSAYQYALLRLTGRNGFAYPGIVVLDFPPTLTDGTRLSGHEDYLIEPFIELLRTEGLEETQVIAAGQGFSELADANRIALSRIWTSGGWQDPDGDGPPPDRRG